MKAVFLALLLAGCGYGYALCKDTCALAMPATSRNPCPVNAEQCQCRCGEIETTVTIPTRAKPDCAACAKECN